MKIAGYPHRSEKNLNSRRDLLLLHPELGSQSLFFFFPFAFLLTFLCGYAPLMFSSLPLPFAFYVCKSLIFLTGHPCVLLRPCLRFLVSLSLPLCFFSL